VALIQVSVLGKLNAQPTLLLFVKANPYPRSLSSFFIGPPLCFAASATEEDQPARLDRASLEKNHQQKYRRLRCGGAATVKLGNSAERQKKGLNLKTSTISSAAI